MDSASGSQEIINVGRLLTSHTRAGADERKGSEYGQYAETPKDI